MPRWRRSAYRLLTMCPISYIRGTEGTVYLTMLLIATVVSTAFAAPLQVQRCRTMTPASFLLGDSVECCNRCSDGFLLQTNWITQTMTVDATSTDMSWDDDLTASFFSLGSGSKPVKETEWLALQRTSVPCGECILPSECVARSGFVNTWHRLCMRPQRRPARVRLHPNSAVGEIGA